MAENKTKQTAGNFVTFLNTIEDEGKRKDCFQIAEMMKVISTCEPKMWGPAIIGFGNYHYTYESGREGDMCMIGFSPRKQHITLYLMGAIANHPDLLEKLGKHTTSKGCLYIKKLSDIDPEILSTLIKNSFVFMKNKYG
ncbi:MAG: DUF1801 domain-containing protein [Ginsengibacter sp.]